MCLEQPAELRAQPGPSLGLSRDVQGWGGMADSWFNHIKTKIVLIEVILLQLKRKGRERAGVTS